MGSPFAALGLTHHSGKVKAMMTKIMEGDPDADLADDIRVWHIIPTYESLRQVKKPIFPKLKTTQKKLYLHIHLLSASDHAFGYKGTAIPPSTDCQSKPILSCHWLSQDCIHSFPSQLQAVSRSLLRRTRPSRTTAPAWLLHRGCMGE